MDTALNTIANSSLAKIAGRASGPVLNAIQTASAKTGVNFAYMVQQAKAESNFDPTAKARTSSASGLYQFIESTWLNMVEKHGDTYGINTQQSRRNLLKLRNDPEIASHMAAEFAKENQDFLEKNWNGDIGSTELYFAHFMGAGGAAAFLNARDDNGGQKAAVLFPEAAKANRSVFYDTRSGRAKSLDQVYAFFDKKFSIDDVQAPAMQQVAAARSKPQSLTEPQSVVWIDGRRETITWHDPVQTARASQSLDLPQRAEKQGRPRSSVFKDQPSHNNTYGYEPPKPLQAKRPTPFYQLVSHPVDVMLMAQMGLPSQVRK